MKPLTTARGAPWVLVDSFSGTLIHLHLFPPFLTLLCCSSAMPLIERSWLIAAVLKWGIVLVQAKAKDSSLGHQRLFQCMDFPVIDREQYCQSGLRV